MTKAPRRRALPDYTLRIKDGPNTSYLLRRSGHVQLKSGTEQDLALSNMFGSQSVEHRLKLENAMDGAGASRLVQTHARAARDGELPAHFRVEVL